jgi:hypothetical protein
MRFLIFIFLICGIAQTMSAQSTIVPADTTKPVETAKKEKQPLMGGLFEEPDGLYPSPKKALQLSLMFPGAGQIYNKKNAAIWAPFWIATTGTGVVGIVYFRGKYTDYRDAYRLAIVGEEHQFSNNPNATPAALKIVRDKNRQYAEQAIFGTIGIYLLNGLQAFTAAHLLNFDMDDDLSMQLKPSIQSIEHGQTPAIGLGMSFSTQNTIQKPVNWLE